jgi:hypothetical protein
MNPIDELLRGNGNTIAGARRRGRSLLGAERRIILRNRGAAAEQGYTRQMVNALEMEGERGTKGHCGLAVSSKFVGLQEIMLFGWSLRLYNVEGDHELNHSTVSVMTLVHNGIMPLDISWAATAREYVKEAVFYAVSGIQSAIRR